MVQANSAARTSEVRISPTQSARLWGLDWPARLPWTFDGITVDACTFDESLPFMQRHYGAIFGAAFEGRFLEDPMTDAKLRFGREMDVFVFRDRGRDGDREIGVLAGHPSDWTTYYMRTVALLPEYRDRHLLSRTMEEVARALAEVGCERIDGEVSPANVAMVRMLTSLGWLVTSTSNSERWGTLLRFTKFLRADAEDVFARQFCGMRLKTTKSGPLSVVAPQERRFP